MAFCMIHTSGPEQALGQLHTSEPEQALGQLHTSEPEQALGRFSLDIGSVVEGRQSKISCTVIEIK